MERPTTKWFWHALEADRARHTKLGVIWRMPLRIQSALTPTHSDSSDLALHRLVKGFFRVVQSVFFETSKRGNRNTDETQLAGRTSAETYPRLGVIASHCQASLGG
jgi:hypothetical protein